MKVTQTADTITHAVIGGKEETEFKVENSAEFFNILSDALYTNKPLATVRETLCNAWDAMIEAGKEDENIRVVLTNQELLIQDFGEGIPDEKMGPLYGTYGGTSKQANANVTGGFGLGCKSPFSICDHFEVISCHNGTRSIWRVSKSSGELNGKPSIKKIVSAPTTETGVTVKIPISKKHNNDDDGAYGRHSYNAMAQSLNKAIIGVVYYGGMNVEYTYSQGGHEGDALPIFDMPFEVGSSGLASVHHAALGKSGVYVRYGNVIYPIPQDEYYDEETRKLTEILQYSDNDILVLQAAPDTIAIAPSREALSLTDTTKKVIKELMVNFLKGFSSEARQIFEKVIEYNYDKASTFNLINRPEALFHTENVPGHYDVRKKKWIAQGGDFAPSAASDIVMTALGRTNYYSHYSNHTRADFMKLIGTEVSASERSLQKAHESGYFNKQHLRRWIQINRFWDSRPTTRMAAKMGDRASKAKSLRKFLRKEVFYRIMRAVREEMGNLRGVPRMYLMESKMEPTMRNGYGDSATYQDPFKERFTPHLAMLRPIIILTHARAKTEERFFHYPEYKEFGGGANTIIVSIPRNKDNPHYVSDMILMLNRLGYYVADMTSRQYFEPREYYERVHVEREARKRGKGFFTLANYEQTFSDVPEKERIHNPRFFVRLDRAIHNNLYTVIGLRRYSFEQYLPLIAKHTCVVWSDTDQRRAEKLGAKNVALFIEKLILHAMKRNHDIRKVLKFVDYDTDDLKSDEIAALDKTDFLIESIMRVRFTRDKYLGIPELSDGDKQIMNAIVQLRSNQNLISKGTYSEALRSKIFGKGVIPVSPKLLSLAKKLATSDVRGWVDVYSLRGAIQAAKSKAEKDRVFKMLNFIIKGN